jgi:DNA-directed RNA polymerase subunit RPC12/RpoP
MTIFYQLPCANCQKTLQVSTTQAGEELPCSCGAKVLVPPLRQLKTFPVAADSAADSVEKRHSKRVWTPAQSGIFAAGILLTAIGIYMHVRSSQARNAIDTSRPQFVELDIDLQQLSPYQAWRTWENVEKVKDQLNYRPTPAFLARRREHAKWTQYRYVSWGIAGVGVCSIVTAFGLRAWR